MMIQLDTQCIEEIQHQAQPLFATTQRYVRITAQRLDGFVEFDFSVDDADLAVELIMSRPMFDAFCRANDVQMIDASDHSIDTSRRSWCFKG
jgi:phenol/toluene 2-monooxygenase (NADH) P0/A0